MIKDHRAALFCYLAVGPGPRGHPLCGHGQALCHGYAGSHLPSVAGHPSLDLRGQNTPLHATLGRGPGPLGILPRHLCPGWYRGGAIIEVAHPGDLFSGEISGADRLFHRTGSIWNPASFTFTR